MLVHKCDRCGAVYEEPNMLLDGCLKYGIKKWVGFTFSDADLCPSCRDGLYEFLMEEEHFRTEEERKEKLREADLGAGDLINKLIGRKK